jgi:hypothetical protein
MTTKPPPCGRHAVIIRGSRAISESGGQYNLILYPPAVGDPVGQREAGTRAPCLLKSGARRYSGPSLLNQALLNPVKGNDNRDNCLHPLPERVFRRLSILINPKIPGNWGSKMGGREYSFIPVYCAGTNRPPIYSC